MTNSTSQIISKEDPAPDVLYRVPNIDRAKDILDFQPKVPLDKGLELTIAWSLKNNASKMEF